MVTDNVNIWPYRNTLQYHLLTWWWGQWGYPQQGEETGNLTGRVVDEAGNPVQDAWLLVSRWDGFSYRARSQPDGNYTLTGLPPGHYVPVVAAPSYESKPLASKWSRLKITAGQTEELNVTLAPKVIDVVSPGTAFALGEITQPHCQVPVDSQTNRQVITFNNAGQPNQLALYYTPISTVSNAIYPLMLTIYPGPADTWECASMPLAMAGYAVLATGPAYSLNLEGDVNELERLHQFAQQGLFPQASPTQTIVLGGSYSSLHVQRLLQRHPTNFKGAVLLGPPTDLFEMRYQLEQGDFIPPFGLDQVLIALGLPDREPMHYWPYSGAYHVQPNYPPILLIHSHNDKVVPIAQSTILAEQLAYWEVPHDVHFFEEADHYLLHEGRESEEIYQLVLNFLTEILQ